MAQAHRLRVHRASRPATCVLLPAPEGGVSDITEQYVKEFGNPPPGSRVFIQTRQHVDGQQDRPVQTDAIVSGQRKRRRATRAAG